MTIPEPENRDAEKDLRLSSEPPWTITPPRKPLNAVITNCPPSGIRRFFDIAQQMENVISLGVGEPDFVTPWRIREAGIWS
ncbi:MAG: Aspartate transaminase, partial [Chthonomonadales bacterium]|nr:Aspartate transaminase [Chthonomonadales bacterium]